MRPATPDELRELSRRSRATQRTGAAAILVALLGVPLAVTFGGWMAYAALGAGGAMLVLYARVAGQERGAFRALFRSLKKSA